MQDTLKIAEELSPADLSPELTKHFRGLRMWLPLHLFGLRPFKAALEEKIWLCRYFYEKIQTLGFEVGPYPDLSIMIYRYVPKSGDANLFNEKLVEYVQRDGRVFLSSTLIDNVFWIRLAVLSFRTHLRELDLCLEVLKAGVQQTSEVFKTAKTLP
jgi:glutamate/tyrosine decarboxylase-like PLP-dependent enzyme